MSDAVDPHGFDRRVPPKPEPPCTCCQRHDCLGFAAIALSVAFFVSLALNAFWADAKINARLDQLEQQKQAK